MWESQRRCSCCGQWGPLCDIPPSYNKWLCEDCKRASASAKLPPPEDESVNARLRRYDAQVILLKTMFEQQIQQTKTLVDLLGQEAGLVRAVNRQEQEEADCVKIYSYYHSDWTDSFKSMMSYLDQRYIELEQFKNQQERHLKSLSESINHAEEATQLLQPLTD